MPTDPYSGLTVPADGMPNVVTLIAQWLQWLSARVFGGLVTTPEVSVTTTTTLTSSAFGAMHVMTGTTADYTVTLPTPTASDVGKTIGFRMSNALTKLVTLNTGNAARTIDGSQTRVMWKDETATLLCVATTGVCYVKIAGKSIPMAAQMHLSANQSLPSGGSGTPITLDLSDVDTGGMVDTANNRILIRRGGMYRVYSQIYFSPGVINRAINNILASGSALVAAEESSANAGSYPTSQVDEQETLAAGTLLTMNGYQDSGGALSVQGHATTRYTFLGVQEKLAW